jgi:DNA polymerase III subunit gamma/tau
VRTMLGAVDRDYAYRIADALKAGDGPALLAEADAMAARGVAFAPALEELASLFHRIAIAQAVPEAIAAMEEGDRVSALARSMPSESVQLAYQICIQGRTDLALAPDEATGFSMTLLRLLAFEPTGGAEPEVESLTPKVSAAAARKAAAAAAAPSAPAAAPQPLAPDVVEHDSAPRVELPTDLARWPAFVASLKLPPIAAQLAAQTELKSIAGTVLTLALPGAHKHLADKVYSDKLKIALEGATGRKWLLAFEVGAIADSSLAAQEKRARKAKQAETEAAFRDEPFVREVLERFDARIRPDSIKPVT